MPATTAEHNALGINLDHLIFRLIEPESDLMQRDEWELRPFGPSGQWVVRTRSRMYRHPDRGPVAHHLECATFHGSPPDGERYTDDQIVRLFRADAAVRHELGMTIVGWCERCAVRKV
jgi:hypothetical protein